MSLTYHHDRRPDIDAIRALYAASPLRRPIGEPERIAKMFEHANVVISAYDGERLVGLLRGWTDFAFDGYVCDLAVHPGYQKRNIGKRLLDEAAALGPDIHWILLASPIAKDYYGHLGWQLIPNAWELPRPSGAMPGYAEYQAEFADLARRA
ncbi:MAG TPA: GNAT family N-acetyltransferase [Holophagaceae bacterium]|nr:GNAT family N-acetyltransferase [Holophagaceae bacterium]